MSGGSDLRRQVLKASLELIKQGGLDRLRCARWRGRQASAITHHHFADREAIRRPRRRGAAKLQEDMDRAAAKAPAKSIAAIEAMGRAYVDFALRHRLISGDVR
jgi:hypothetical protein